jgi:hypothetical protein
LTSRVDVPELHSAAVERLVVVHGFAR